ncbi:MAG: hypothetical protein GW859_01760 [Sphingomonadales bacterium]|nr:hypothetical protein [Sphingomonadales bacterium]
MITFFRRIFESKIGLIFSLAFIALIAIAFAGADVTGTSFGGVSGGNVAKVGKTSISVGDLRDEVKRRFDAARQENPTLDLATFVNSGGLDSTLNSLVEGAALEAYAAKLGFGSSKALEDAEIRKIPNFFGIDGTFDQNRFETALKNVGLTERMVREDIRRQILVRQLAAPVLGIEKLPRGLALPYASLLLEQRAGQAAFIAAGAYAPEGEPDAKTISQFYARNASRYTIPERRVIRYAEFGEASVGKAGTVSDAEIAKYYADNRAQYAAKETRGVAQVIAGDRATAEKIAAKAKQGGTLQAAAQANGLSASDGTFESEAALAASIGKPAAKAVFAAGRNDVVGPIQGPLGWIVTRVNTIEGTPARSLASVTGELRDQLQTRKKQEALIDLYNTLQDALSGGADISELAETRNLKIETTPPLTADGRVAGGSEPAIAAELAPVVAAAFQASEENFGELVTIEENKRFAIVDVADIRAAAPPPLKEIRERVVRDYKLSEGAKKAKSVARKVADRIEKGATIADALKAENVPPFVLQKIGGKRAELNAAEGRVPPELALLFSMAPKTVKTLEMGRDQGWMVVYLAKIDEGDAGKDPKLLEAVSTQLTGAISNEYAAGLLNAAKQAVGVELNQGAIEALKRELTGQQP